MSLNREADILSLQALVLKIARYLASQLPSGIDLLEDFTQAGWVGAIKAVDSFDASAGASLKTYANYRIRGAILDFMREEDSLSRDERERTERNIEKFHVRIDSLLETYQLTDERAAADFESVDANVELLARIRYSQISNRCKNVLIEYYELNLSMQQIGDHSGVSASRVSQMHHESIIRLRECTPLPLRHKVAGA